MKRASLVLLIILMPMFANREHAVLQYMGFLQYISGEKTTMLRCMCSCRALQVSINGRCQTPSSQGMFTRTSLQGSKKATGSMFRCVSSRMVAISREIWGFAGAHRKHDCF